MHNFLVKTNYMLGMLQILILIYYKFDMVMPYIMCDNTHQLLTFTCANSWGEEV